MNDAAQKIYDFMDTVERLCYVKRYTVMRNGDREKDSDHIMKLMFMIMMITPYIKQQADAQKMLEMALVHDLVEADAGDVPSFEQTPEVKDQKTRREKEVIEKYRTDLPEPIGQKIYDLFMEFENQKTPESKIVRAFDRFESNIQCLKENYGARYWQYAGRSIMKALRDKELNLGIDEEIIDELSKIQLGNAVKNIEYCKECRLIDKDTVL
ncbi:MAG: HD domain-containing protein [Rickettsiales bacterium]|jgi:5'-deoxynucleotidase YfbR-like HD superfamily hydrolase|nr:HD domain-containing protein [Rickettsiales bacterium]